MLPQPYTPFPEEGASQRIHPFPQSLVSVTDPAAQMSWGKRPPQRVPASLWTILNMMTKQNSKWKQYTKFHSQLFSKYDTDYRQECKAKSALKEQQLMWKLYQHNCSRECSTCILVNIHKTLPIQNSLITFSNVLSY